MHDNPHTRRRGITGRCDRIDRREQITKYFTDMTHEQFITELASLRDLMEAMKEDDRDMWRALYKGNDPETEKALRNISEAAAAISKTAEAMRVNLQTVG